MAKPQVALLPLVNPMPQPTKAELKAQRRLLRRAWLYKLLYGLGGHLLALVLTLALFLKGLATMPLSGALGLVQLLVLLHMAVACIVNRWLYNEEIVAMQSREAAVLRKLNHLRGTST